MRKTHKLKRFEPPKPPVWAPLGTMHLGAVARPGIYETSALFTPQGVYAKGMNASIATSSKRAAR